MLAPPSQGYRAPQLEKHCSRKLKMSRKETIRAPERNIEEMIPSTSRFNLRSRNGTSVEFQPTIEMKTQQERPVRARNSRGKQYNPYIEEHVTSGNKKTKRRGNQQQNGQEKKGGANTNQSISLEVLEGDANYKS
ncbi:hypothetical protein TNCV_3382261 [Trichonephila clavipes]|nr:hypothetical protein TNCV_3382261 [Trichonephila clavipes]